MTDMKEKKTCNSLMHSIHIVELFIFSIPCGVFYLLIEHWFQFS